jgi:hypothetical protein
MAIRSGRETVTGSNTRSGLKSGLALACAGLLALAAPVTAQDKSQVMRIIPGGMDGKSVSYTVRCKNGTSATMLLRPAENQVCATPMGGKTQCKEKWVLMEAAEHSCKSSGRG